MFKVTGGFSVFLIISGIASDLNKIYYFSIFTVSFVFILYRIVIGFYALKQWVINLKSGIFVVRNSPLDILATVLKGGVSSIKAATKFTFGTGMTYCLAHEIYIIFRMRYI